MSGRRALPALPTRLPPQITLGAASGEMGLGLVRKVMLNLSPGGPREAAPARGQDWDMHNPRLVPLPSWPATNGLQRMQVSPSSGQR